MFICCVYREYNLALFHGGNSSLCTAYAVCMRAHVYVYTYIIINIQDTYVHAMMYKYIQIYTQARSIFMSQTVAKAMLHIDLAGIMVMVTVTDYLF
jgi:hypothetical protein